MAMCMIFQTLLASSDSGWYGNVMQYLTSFVCKPRRSYRAHFFCGLILIDSNFQTIFCG